MNCFSAIYCERSKAKVGNSSTQPRLSATRSLQPLPTFCPRVKALSGRWRKSPRSSTMFCDIPEKMIRTRSRKWIGWDSKFKTRLSAIATNNGPVTSHLLWTPVDYAVDLTLRYSPRLNHSTCDSTILTNRWRLIVNHSGFSLISAGLAQGSLINDESPPV